MPNNYRPYWQRHRIQLRLVALLMLLLYPVVVAVALAIDNWDDIKMSFMEIFRDAFLPHKDV